MLTRYLLEDPWPAVVVLGCVAFALLVTGMRRNRGAWHVAAGVAALAAGGVYVLAATVQTDRERVEQRTRELVAATAPLDAPTLRQLIDDQATVTLPGGEPLRLAGVLSDELISAVDRFAVESQSIRGLHVEAPQPGAATARLDVRTVLGGDVHYPVRTEWLITWRRGDDGRWRVAAVQWLEFQNRPPTQQLWQ